VFEVISTQGTCHCALRQVGPIQARLEARHHRGTPGAVFT
jgi:hypothetical protein